MILTITELIYIKYLKHILAEVNALWMLVLIMPNSKF